MKRLPFGGQYMCGFFCILLLFAPGGDLSAEEGKKPFVEFDFSAVPQNCTGDFKYTLTINTADKDLDFSGEGSSSRGRERKNLCATVELWLRINKFEVEIVDEVKLRVYGRTFNEKLIPAIGAKFESKDLKAEELPKIKNPPKA